MKQISLQDFAKLFDSEIHVKLFMLANNPETTGLVCFTNQQFDSSGFGNRIAMAIGPTRTYKSVDEVKGKHLNDLPSQRCYPEYYWLKEASEK